MDYTPYVEQYCPPAVQQSVIALAAGLSPDEESLALNEISGAQMSPDCVVGVVGQLSPLVQPTSSTLFKLQYMGLLITRSDLLAANPAADQLRVTVEGVMRRLLDDVRKPNLSGSMLPLMLFMRINLLDEIKARIDVGNPDLSDPYRAWPLQEYALCMRDPGAQERINRLFAASDPQTLRRIFQGTAVLVKVRKTYCTDREALKELVAPYLQDVRKTHDVNGPGPAVSHYARQLAAVL